MGMEYCVSLKSEVAGEINRFLSVYFRRERCCRYGSLQVTYLFDNPVAAHNMVNVFVDNESDFDAQLWVVTNTESKRVSQGNLYEVLTAILSR